MPREDERLVCEIHGGDVGFTTDQGSESTLQFCRDDAFVQPEFHAGVFPS